MNDLIYRTHLKEQMNIIQLLIKITNMVRTKFKKSALVVQTCFLSTLLLITPSFIIKTNNFPAPLQFYWMQMTATDAKGFINKPEFNYFIFQNKNPDNTGSARHDFELTTFTHFSFYDYSNPVGQRPGPHDTYLQRIPIPPPPPNKFKVTDIPNKVNLANFKLTKTELSKLIPPDASFAFLVFEPIECTDKEKNYVCYRIYPVNTSGIEIKGAGFLSYTTIMHPSPPAGFD